MAARNAFESWDMTTEESYFLAIFGHLADFARVASS